MVAYLKKKSENVWRDRTVLEREIKRCTYLVSGTEGTTAICMDQTFFKFLGNAGTESKFYIYRLVTQCV